MGDRANFGFVLPNGPYDTKERATLYLYGHWAGEGMMNNLARALKAAEPRWQDDAYATRICISHLIGDSWHQETGWGISIGSLCDNEHSVPVVDWEAQTVSLYPYDWDTPFTTDTEPKFTMSLPAFVIRFLKED